MNEQYLDEKYLEGRVYHGIAVRLLKNNLEEFAEDVIGVSLKGKSVVKGSTKYQYGNSDKECNWLRTTYSINVDFAASLESETKDVFSYGIYFVLISVDSERQYVLICAPFINMIKYICNAISKGDKTKGKGVYFQKSRISRVLELLDPDRKKGEPFPEEITALTDSLHITGLTIQLPSEKLTRVLTFKGDHIPGRIKNKSSAYFQIIKTLKSKHPKNYSCKVTYRQPVLNSSDESETNLVSKWSMLFDRFGKYSFRIGKGASNLSYTSRVFELLIQYDAINETSAVPKILSVNDMNNE